MDPIHDPLHGSNRIKLIPKSDQPEIAYSGSVDCSTPLRVVTKNFAAKSLKASDLVMGVYNNVDTQLKTTCTVLGVSEVSEGIQIELLDQPWEDLNRRQYPRYLARVPIEIRAIEDCDFKTCYGVTSDISMGGTRVISDQVPLVGTLVRVKAETGTEGIVDALGLVVHAQPEIGSYGVKFLDLIGASQKYLGNFFSAF